MTRKIPYLALLISRRRCGLAYCSAARWKAGVVAAADLVKSADFGRSAVVQNASSPRVLSRMG